MGGLLATVVTSLGTISPAQLAFFWIPVWERFQFWRLFTNFIYFGSFGLSFVFQLYMLAHYAVAYEKDPLRAGLGGGGRGESHPSAEFVVALLFCGAIHIVVGGIYLEMPILSSVLAFSVIYLWSRVHESEQIKLFGFAVPALYYPWALTALHTMMGSSPFPDLLGIAAGHIYYLLVEVLPEDRNWRLQLLSVPPFLNDFFEGRHVTQARNARTGRTERYNRGGAGGHNWGTGGQTLGGN